MKIKNYSIKYVNLTRTVLFTVNVMTATHDDIINFLEHLKKPESEDPLHKWIGTYNLYLTILKKFFKWFNNPYCLEGLKLLKRQEKSVYRPSDLWSQEDDEIFLRYCPSKRDRCYHMMARDSSCRPSELLKQSLRIWCSRWLMEDSLPKSR
jgi:hypothetical protein